MENAEICQFLDFKQCKVYFTNSGNKMALVGKICNTCVSLYFSSYKEFQYILFVFVFLYFHKLRTFDCK